MTLPIACTLTTAELRERREKLLRKVGASVQETVELENGYAFRFPAERFEDVAQVVALERECCAFLRMTLTVEPGAGPVWLEMTGPATAKSFIASLWS